jgi:hypothetical protein
MFRVLTCLTVEHDWRLVLLAGLVCFVASIVAVNIFHRAIASQTRTRFIWVAIAGAAIGYGIWATHFIGMLSLRLPIDFHGVDSPLWSRSDRGFLVMVNMNKLPRLSRSELYTERMRAIEFFSRTNDIDLYGVDWDKASRRMGRSRIPGLRRAQIAINDWVDTIRPHPLLVAARKVYKGELQSKWETLASYDFALCFENAYIKGWLTEKLFECLRVGTIPIYWGATDIEELVPPDCFIDMRQFTNYSELLECLKALDRETVRRYREAGRAFLESKAFNPFSKERFAGIFKDLLEQDAGVRLTL